MQGKGIFLRKKEIVGQREIDRDKERWRGKLMCIKTKTMVRQGICVRATFYPCILDCNKKKKQK